MSSSRLSWWRCILSLGLCAARGAAAPSSCAAAQEGALLPAGCSSGRRDSALVQTQAYRVRSIEAAGLQDDVDRIIDRVVFVKTAATGGSTFSGILHRFCENHGKRCYIFPQEKIDRIKVEFESFLPIERPELEELAHTSAGKYDVWPNHVMYYPELFRTLIPGAFTISVFREPLPRIMSSIRHGWVEDATTLLSSLMHNTVVDHPLVCGFAGLQMSDQVPKEAYDDLDFVMLTEQYDKSLMMLRRVLGWRASEMMYRPLKEKEDEDVLEVVEKLREFVSRPEGELNDATKTFLEQCAGKEEQEVYARAVESFEAQWKHLSTAEQEAIEQEVALFEQVREQLEACCDQNEQDAYCAALLVDNVDWNRRAVKEQVAGVVLSSMHSDTHCFQMVKIALGDA
mmetsp:Transcript_10879/g.24704  ORF Transcript_10879/g.24704 Transcript_10879/m.24704 type:complete len:399 (+) Transcript_10879:52-1248(+)